MNIRHAHQDLHLVQIYSVIVGQNSVEYAGPNLDRAQEIFYAHLHISDQRDITLLRGDTWMLKFRTCSTEQSN